MAVEVGVAFLSASLQVLFDRLSSEEFLSLFRGEQESLKLLEELNIRLISVNKLINDAEEKQLKDKEVARWLDNLKDVIYKADDLVDKIDTEVLRRKVEGESSRTTLKPSRPCSADPPPSSRPTLQPFDPPTTNPALLPPSDDETGAVRPCSADRAAAAFRRPCRRRLPPPQMYTFLVLTVLMMIGTSSSGGSPGGGSPGGDGPGGDPPRKVGFIDKLLGKGKKKKVPTAPRTRKHADRARDGSLQSGGTKNARGLNKGIATYQALEAYRRAKGDPNILIPLTLDPLTNTVYDAVANTKFATFCGQAVRRFCSLADHYWARVPDDEKIQMRMFLRSAYDVTDDILPFVDATLSLQWRRYRGDLKKMYEARAKEGMSAEINLTRVPPQCGVELAWKNMIIYWDQEATQNYSRQMSENRSKQVMQYRGGAHLMRQYVHDANAQPPQEGDDDTPPLNAIETFYGVHFRDGAWQNEHDEAAYEQMIQAQAATQAEEGVDELDDDAVNAIVRTVLKSSAKWDTGFGRAPTQRERQGGGGFATQQQTAINTLQQRLDESEARHAEAEARHAETEARHRREMDAIHALLRQQFPGYSPGGGGGGESSSAQQRPPYLGDP